MLQEQAVAASAPALLQLAMFLWHTGSQERARACIESALDTTPGDIACTSLLGWILIHPTAEETVQPDEEDVEHAARLFEQTLHKSPKHVEVCTSHVNANFGPLRGCHQAVMLVATSSRCICTHTKPVQATAAMAVHLDHNFPISQPPS